jgi:chemotaxis signal transduction protein
VAIITQQRLNRKRLVVDVGEVRAVMEWLRLQAVPIMMKFLTYLVFHVQNGMIIIKMNVDYPIQKLLRRQLLAVIVEEVALVHQMGQFQILLMILN